MGLEKCCISTAFAVYQLHECMYVCMHVCMYVCMHVCMCVYMCVCVHTVLMHSNEYLCMRVINV